MPSPTHFDDDCDDCVWPHPVHNSVRCLTCGRRGAAVRAKHEFLARIEAQGAKLAPGVHYVGTATPVEIICARGHVTRAHPRSVQQGWGACNPCGKQISKEKNAAYRVAKAADAFAARVAAQGAKLAPGAHYVDNNTPVAVVCATGHECHPRPGSVQKGRGVCAQCDVRFDRVYLMTHELTQAIKVGIASGPVRVHNHETRGYHLAAQWTRLDHYEARRVERAVINFWRGESHGPVTGAPRDGRSETAPLDLMDATLAMLIDELGRFEQ